MQRRLRRLARGPSSGYWVFAAAGELDSGGEVDLLYCSIYIVVRQGRARAGNGPGRKTACGEDRQVEGVAANDLPGHLGEDLGP